MVSLACGYDAYFVLNNSLIWADVESLPGLEDGAVLQKGLPPISLTPYIFESISS